MHHSRPTALRCGSPLQWMCAVWQVDKLKIGIGHRMGLAWMKLKQKSERLWLNEILHNRLRSRGAICDSTIRHKLGRTTALGSSERYTGGFRWRPSLAFYSVVQARSSPSSPDRLRWLPS